MRSLSGYLSFVGDFNGGSSAQRLRAGKIVRELTNIFPTRSGSPLFMLDPGPPV